MNLSKRNNVKITGSGDRTIVFAHGFGCDQNAWGEVAPAFAKDFRVILFDHVGAGGSDCSAYDPARYDKLQGYADDYIDLADELGLTGATFVGHSVAGMIGMLAAIRRPDLFSSLIMLAPSPCYVDDSGYRGGFSQQDITELLEVLESNFFMWSRATAPAIMGNSDRPELGERLASTFCRTDPQIARHFARVTFLSDHREDLPLCMVPTVVLQSSADMIAPPEVGAYMVTRLPNARLIYLTASGHCPHMSAPHETVATILGLLCETYVA